MTETMIGEINSRRLETPGEAGWQRSVDPQSADRYLTISVDSHVSEPVNVYELGGLDPKYRDRVPHVVRDSEGREFLMVEGWDKPNLVKGKPKDGEELADLEDPTAEFQMWSDRMEPDDLERQNASSTRMFDEPTLTRFRQDMERDGVDGAVAFANRAILSWATYDDEFALAMSHAYNVWAWETYGAHSDRFIAAAQLTTADVDAALKELDWIASTGFRAINIPCKPLHGHRGANELSYNHPSFDRLWAAIEETGLPVCMHAATGRDPRAASGSGGAIINKAVGFLRGTMEPLATFLASGVFEKHPGLQLATIEADFGWLPWMLEELDRTYLKHHMWVRPWTTEPPSHYWYTNCWASFMEDNVGVRLADQYKLTDRIMWSNDYPHHEGTWPHSSAAIQRQLQGMTEAQRENALGLNAARFFGFNADHLRSLRTSPSAAGTDQAGSTP
ncbi:amidohydrolase family protein [Pseudonocardia ailaonensis]|uniref:Amidohydrolase family protein n=1 Tax=Pseudonocardia ailaonensis TaxID=367279 RepID=A0ABN2NCM5_9PSEU